MLEKTYPPLVGLFSWSPYQQWGKLRKHKLDAGTRVMKAGCPEVLFVKLLRMRRSIFDALVDKCWCPSTCGALWALSPSSPRK